MVNLQQTKSLTSDTLTSICKANVIKVLIYHISFRVQEQSGRAHVLSSVYKTMYVVDFF